MAKLQILHFPDPRLRNKARAVDDVDDDVRRLIDHMLETMYDAPGIGLAATQVNDARRVVTIDISAESNEPLCLVNPEIVHHEGEIVWNEGCLSVPDFQADVERSERVVVRGTDLDGEPYEEDARELRAVCFQHEIDHLDGILFIDRISRLKRSLYVKKRKKAIRLEEEEGGAAGSGGTAL